MASLKKQRLVIVTNTSVFFLTHRLGLALEAQKQGFEVCILAPESEWSAQIIQLGFQFTPIAMDRKSTNPLGELKTLGQLFIKLRNLQPDIVHTFTIKPNIYCGLLNHWLRFPKLIATITGLGSVFLDTSSKGRVLQAITGFLYWLAFRRENVQVIFQNQDDQSFFLARSWCRSARTYVIPGTGVNTDKFKPENTYSPGSPVRILFASRFLKDKGLSELIYACDRLAKDGLNFRLQLCGKIDPGNPTSFTPNEMNEITNRSYVHNLGYQTDMTVVYHGTDIVCLPSYREGLSLTLVEATSCGLPIVTTNVPGCRDLVKNGLNGYVVPPGESTVLAQKLRELIESPDLRRKMGVESRSFAVAHLRSELVLNKFIDLYRGN